MSRNSNLLVVLVLLFLCGGTVNLSANGKADLSDSGSVPVLEVWWGGYSQFEAETESHPFVQRAVKELGIGWERPTVPWGGGTDYGERLKLRLAAGDPPDVIRLPFSGFSIPELIDGGVAADLTDLLPVYAPTLYKSIPESQWKIAKSQAPDKKSIYCIPTLRELPTHGAFIRKDWLDRVGLGIPKTEEEFYKVLEAFKTMDANGNGDPDDEIPTTGRGPGRWWDHLFTPYGVAMVEGFPSWDIYDGKLQYSAVQPEMKEALSALTDSFDRGLIDPEVLVNTNSVWNGKIYGDSVGVFFHMPFNIWQERLTYLYRDFPEAEWVWLPPMIVSGVGEKWSEGYVSNKNTGEYIIINNTEDEQTVINALKLLEWLQQPEVIENNIWGIEGIHYTVKDGKRVRRTDNLEEQKKIPTTFSESPVVITKELSVNQGKINIMSLESESLRKRVSESFISIMDESKVIEIPGTSLPSSVYDGYPDIRSHKLYFSMMAKVMVGKEPLDEALDEFVREWYATGGKEVTARVQETAAELDL